jgi:hypothetical protein
VTKSGGHGLLSALIHWSFTIFIDYALLRLLGIVEGLVGGLLNRNVPLKNLTVISSILLE